MTRVVLLVEDNPSDEKLTLRAFKKGGLSNDVVVARTGGEALDYLFATGQHAARDPQAEPAVVLLDLKLPDLDGLEVLRRLREHPRTKLCPVVVLTSSVQDEDLTRSYSLGANAYVRKPVDFTEFIEAAKVLGLFWLLHNEPAPPPRGSS
jgi:two-component system response regulator